MEVEYIEDEEPIVESIAELIDVPLPMIPVVCSEERHLVREPPPRYPPISKSKPPSRKKIKLTVPIEHAIFACHEDRLAAIKYN